MGSPFGRRAYDGIARRVGGVWTWTISPITGEDGRPSWAKLITFYVVTLYLFTPDLPTNVAITAIFAAHGIKALMAWGNRRIPREEAEGE